MAPEYEYLLAYLVSMKNCRCEDMMSQEFGPCFGKSKRVIGFGGDHARRRRPRELQTILSNEQSFVNTSIIIGASRLAKLGLTSFIGVQAG